MPVKKYKKKFVKFKKIKKSCENNFFCENKNCCDFIIINIHIYILIFSQNILYQMTVKIYIL